MTRDQKIITAALAMMLAVAGFFGYVGWKLGRDSVKIPEPQIIVDTVTITEVRIDTVERIRTVTAWLPAADPDDEPMDTIDAPCPIQDSVAVQIPISRYVAQEDSLYRVVAEGYAVEFREITVYPKTITEQRYIEVPRRTRWGIGIQAGYGATITDRNVKLAPYIGVGLSYNIITW